MVTSLNIKTFVEDRNPFVGPQPMRVGDPIFGRDREITALRHFIAAERIVLLHSPSGAGKSSLVSAGLIPKLSDRFEIWGPTRVNQTPPAGVANRFTWSAILGFEQSLRRDKNAGTTSAHLVEIPETLSRLTLAEYVAQRERAKSPLLIFDQFEEILRVDSFDTETKHAFFAQLGELLADSRIWALFVMREDYLAPLDPYVRQVPTHFQNRYRIDRLKRDMAKEAIVRPTANLNRKFDDEAVDALVRSLATVQAQQFDGTFADQVGEYVEPLQLQVVCYDVWTRKKPGDLVIGVEDVGDNISGALKNYYDHSVRMVAGENESVERDIREWFQEKLITPDGVRSQVRQEHEQSGGLDNTYVSQLLDTYLVRAEPRGFTNWYELAHDRLIAPLRDSNRKWLNERLSKLQKVAAVWDKERRSPGLLLRGKDLQEVKKWARENPASMHAVERDFLAAAAVKQRAIWLGHGLRLLIVGLAVGLWFSRQQAVEAERRAQIVFGRLFKQKARDYLQRARSEGTPGRLADSWVYATASMTVSPEPVPESAGRLLLTTSIPGAAAVVEECLKASDDSCASPQAAAIFGGGPGKVLYSTAGSVACDRCDVHSELTGVVASLSASANRYAAGLQNGEVHVLSGDEKRNLGSPVTALAYRENGTGLAAGTAKGEVFLLDERDLKTVSSTACLDCGAVLALAWNEDGTVLAAAFANLPVRLYRADLSAMSVSIDMSHVRKKLTSLAFWPATPMLAAGNSDGLIYGWDTRSGAELVGAKVHGSAVLSLAFDRAADQLVSVSTDGDIHRTSLSPSIFGRKWDLKTFFLDEEGAPLRKQLDETSRRMLGYSSTGEEPEAGADAPAKALEFFQPRKLAYHD